VELKRRAIEKQLETFIGLRRPLGERSRKGLRFWSEIKMYKRELLGELLANPKKIRFARVCKIAEGFGFQTRRSSGSHRIYYKENVIEILNFQNDGGWAKPYQVRQFTKVIEKYDLHEV
jgi:hypothetical protein